MLVVTGYLMGLVFPLPEDDLGGGVCAIRMGLIWRPGNNRRGAWIIRECGDCGLEEIQQGLAKTDASSLSESIRFAGEI